MITQPTTPGSGGKLTASRIQIRLAATRRVTLVGLFGGAVVSLVTGLVYGQLGTWPVALISATAAAVVLLSAVSYLLLQLGQNENAPWPALFGLVLCLPALSLAVGGVGLALAVVGALLLPRLLRPAIRESAQAQATYLAIGAGVAALLIDIFNPAGRFQLPIPEVILLGLNVLILILFLFRIGQEFAGYSLQTKLLLASLAVSVIPLSLQAYLSYQSTRTALREAANENLMSSASQLASQIDAFTELNLNSVRTTAQMISFGNYMSLPEEDRRGSTVEGMALSGLEVHKRIDVANVISYGLLDTQGRNVLDSNEDLIGRDESDRDYFQNVIETGQAYASQVQVGANGQPYLYFSAPVRNPSGQLVGVLRAQWRARVLQQIVAAGAAQAGEDAFAVVFDSEHFIHLAHSTAPETIMKAAGPLNPELEAQLIESRRLPDRPSSELTTNLPDLVEKLERVDQDPFFEATDVATGDQINQVAVVATESQPWRVAFFQPRAVLFTPAVDQARRTVVLSLLIVTGVVVGALAMSSLLARPITSLTESARRIAEGDLTAQADVSSQDELGLLATTFNGMTRRLRELIVGLEDRVAERTQDLERRARQLQAASDVAKGAAAAREVDELLNEAVNRIQERFDYYHAAVFLVDETTDRAVLRAASSPGGKRMLARGHALDVGKVGLVGYVTGTGKSRVARDVGEDAVHFANPDLPETRSEAALPLISGTHVIGALDVQSKEPNAFDEQDIVALQTMADQLAIAIQNASLLQRQTELAADRRRAIDVYRQLTRSMSYDQILADTTRLIRSAFGFDRVILGLSEVNEVVIRSASAGTQERLPRLGQGVPMGQGLLGRAVSTNAPVRIDESTLDVGARVDPVLGELEASLCVPLVSRGQAIGALAVERESDYVYDDSDIELLELLASQAAVSIENARLFEETQQRLRQVDALYRRQTSEAWELLVNARRIQGEENRASYGEEEIESLEGVDPVEASISLRGEVIGKLDVLPQRPEEWSEEDLEILHDVAEEVAGQLEQLRLVEEIQRRATHLETAAEIARVATGLLDLDPLLKKAVNLIRDRFGFYHVAVYLVEGDGHTAYIREASGDTGEALKQTRRRFEVGKRSVVGFVTGSGEYYVAHDTETDPYYKPSDLLPESRSELAVPLKIGDRVIGALDVHDKGRYAFSEDDIVVLETLADQMAVAVENARLFQEALQRAEREQSVVQITSKIRASQDIDSILRTAVEEMRAALGARRATIRLAPVPVQARGNGQEKQEGKDNDGPGNSADGRGTSPSPEVEG